MWIVFNAHPDGRTDDDDKPWMTNQASLCDLIADTLIKLTLLECFDLIEVFAVDQKGRKKKINDSECESHINMGAAKVPAATDEDLSEINLIFRITSVIITTLSI